MNVDSKYTFTARDGTNLFFYRTSAPLPSPTDIDGINKRYKNELGVRVRNARFTNEYNCHGLTFVAKLGWFDDVRKILSCHGYKQVGSCPNFEVDRIILSSEVIRGDIVVYYDGSPDKPTHTGIVWGKRILRRKLCVTILSKWGNSSEYFHRHDKVPIEYGKSIEIWTDRSV